VSGRPGGRREIPLPQGSRYSGHGNVLHDLAAAIHTGQKPVHDGRWGKATLDAALAIQASAREGREIMLKHQVAV
jgi:phthalate 4,5-cis-dihydrodiol dehydrogenase